MRVSAAFSAGSSFAIDLVSFDRLCRPRSEHIDIRLANS